MKTCDGTRGDYYRHRYHNEQPCPESRQAAADYERERQRRRGSKPQGTARCGTNRGYNRHQWLREEPCGPCRRAHAWHNREWRAGNLGWRPQTIPELIIDVLETHGVAMTPAVLADEVTRIRPAVSWESVRTVVSRMGSRGDLVEKEPGKWWTT